MPGTKNVSANNNAQAIGWADAAITRNAAGRVGIPAITLTQGTITADAPILDGSVTWNNAGVTFCADRINITDSASNAASLLIDRRVGGTSKFRVGKSGSVQIGGATGTSEGIYASNWLILGGTNNYDVVALRAGEISVGAAQISFGSALYAGSSALIHDGTGALAQRAAANPQTFRLYNTFTDASNYERGFMRWNSNVLEFGMNKAGTGTARDIRLITDSGNTLTLSDGGLLYLTSTLYLNWSGRGQIRWPATGVMLLTDHNGSTIDRVQFGGTSSSFPSLKRSTTILQARLADDSGFASVQAKLHTDANAATETIVPDKTLTLYDAAGTAYKVPCVAA